MTAISQALRTALLHFVWQGLVVALLLWVTLYLLRRRSAQARYLASCAALASLMAMPVVTAYVVYQTPSVAVSSIPLAQRDSSAVATVTAKPESASFPWMVGLESWALPLWSVGVLIFSLRLVWGCWRVSTMRRRGRPADAAILSVVADLGVRLGLARPVRVLTAALPDGPSVVGWLRPVLLLPPAALLGLTPEQLEVVLAHELAHIRRYDHLVNAVQSLIETLLFYHPAVWWTSARIREERELCCDDLAVHACGDALCFARALTKLERLRVMTPAPALGSTGGPLMYRVQRLVGVAHQECAPSKLSGILAFSLGLLCLALNVHWAHAQTATTQTRGNVIITVPFHPTGDDTGVTVDLGGAAMMHRPAVTYPEAARTSNIEGSVLVQVSLDGSGNVSDAHVVSGPMELRKAVMQSIFEWHFASNASGGIRTVNVTFQKPAADAKPRLELRPGVLGSVERDTALAPEERLKIEQRQQQLQEARAAVEAAQDLDSRRRAEENLVKLDHATTGYAFAEGTQESQRMEQLQNQLQDARAAVVRAGDGDSRRRAEEELVKLERSLEEQTRAITFVQVTTSTERPHEGEVGWGPHRIGDQKLARIEISSLPEAVRAELLARLPIQLGDILTGSKMEAVGAAIRKFDEHLNWRVNMRGDGAAIIIESPGGAVWTGK